MKSLFFFILLTLHALAAEFPDGAWNGKPLDRATLENAAAEGNRDAMAELAYCSQHTLLGIPYDSGKIISFSDLAARNGSALAMTVFAEVLIHGYGFPLDQERGLALLRKASDIGHPHAMALLADYMFVASHPRTQCGGIVLAGIEPDQAAAMDLLTKAEAAGTLFTDAVRYRIHRYGLGVPEDVEKGFGHMIRYVETSASPEFAGLLFNLAHVRGSNYADYIPEATRPKQEAIARAGAALGNPHAIRRVGSVEKITGNANIGVPMVIRSLNNGVVGALSTVPRWTRYYDYDSRAKAYTVTGDIEDVFKMCAEAYERGYDRSNVFIGGFYASGLSRSFKKNGEPALYDEAVGVYRDLLINLPDYNDIYNGFAFHLFTKKAEGEEAKRIFERCTALWTYRATQDKYAAHWLAWILRTREVYGGKFINYPQAVAAIRYASTRNQGAYKAGEEKWLGQILPRMSAAQKEEAERLVEDGFPHALKYRKAAFETLQNAGDIPAGTTFEEDGGASLAPTPSDLMLCAADATLDKEALLRNFLTGEKLPVGSQLLLTEMLLSPAEGLRKTIEPYSKDFPAETERVLAIIGEETAIMKEAEPVGAGLGWYLIYENGELTSIPFVNRLTKGSPAALGGLLLADAIEGCNGVSLRSEDSRNRFVRLLRLWPTHLPLELSVRRSEAQPSPAHDNRPKRVNKELTISDQADLD